MAISIDSFNSQTMGNGLPVIKVVGIGGGGGNVVNRMIEDNVKGVDYITMNTDAMALNSSKADIVMHIGNEITKGLGAGMRPEIGKQSAEADFEIIEEALHGADMVFLAAGMGGGTGTGAIPVVAEIAKEMDILTVAVVTTPFSFEGNKREKLAVAGIEELRKHIDTLVVIPNTKLLEIASKKTTMVEAFSIADDVLKQAISGITNLVNLEGVINLDFADLKTVMEDKGSALMGTGIGHGQQKGLDAVKRAINSPLISKPISGATGIIINIIADENFPLLEAETAATYVQSTANKDADVIFGLVYDHSLKDEVSVTVIATGYEKSYKEKSTRLFRAPLRIADSLKSKKGIQKQERRTPVSKPREAPRLKPVEPRPVHVEPNPRPIVSKPKPAEPRPKAVESKPKPAEPRQNLNPQKPVKEEPKENTDEIELPYFMRRR